MTLEWFGKKLVARCGIPIGMALTVATTACSDAAVPNESVSQDSQDSEELMTVSFVADRDVTIQETVANQGSDTRCQARAETGALSRMSCLLHFPVTLPVNAIVMSVTLHLYVLNSSTQPFQVWLLRTWWSEEVATWQNRITTHLWQADGARGSLDRDPTGFFTYSFSTTGPLVLDLQEMDYIVQGWASWSPSFNKGILITSTANTDGFSFATKEHATLDPPTLVVTYKQP